jgi:hypothetical protein
MKISALILFLSVMLLGGFLTYGLALAGSRDKSLTLPERQKLMIRGGVLFMSVVALDLVVGSSGILLKFDQMPPPFMLFFLTNLAIAFGFAFSPFGTVLARYLSFSALIGFQGFRILAELLLYSGLREGITPVQMTFEGYNFDIVTGVSAILLSLYLRKNPAAHMGLIRAWNFMGVGFLLIIAFVALTSLPVPFRVFMNEPSNIWVGLAPYTLLPGVLVVAAVVGHILVFRKLAQTAS